LLTNQLQNVFFAFYFILYMLSSLRFAVSHFAFYTMHKVQKKNAKVNICVKTTTENGHYVQCE